MKKLILITGVFLSASLWASPMDDVCLIETQNDGYLTAEEADVYVSVRNIPILKSLAFNESLKVVSLSLSIITFR